MFDPNTVIQFALSSDWIWIAFCNFQGSNLLWGGIFINSGHTFLTVLQTLKTVLSSKLYHF